MGKNGVKKIGVILKMGQESVFYLSAPESFQPENAIEEAEEVRFLLSGLSPREMLVVRMRYGLKPYEKEHILKEIGLAIKTSGAMAEKVLKRALRRMESKSKVKFKDPFAQWRAKKARKEISNRTKAGL